MNFTVFKSSRRKCVHIYIYVYRHTSPPCSDYATDYPRQKVLTLKPLKPEYPDVLTVRSCHKTQALSAGIANPRLLNHMKAEWVRMWLPLRGWSHEGEGPEGQEGLAQPEPPAGEISPVHTDTAARAGPLGPRCALDPDPFAWPRPLPSCKLRNKT